MHMFARRRGRNDIANFYLAIGNHHAINEQLNEVAFLFKACLI
jgi:hypothetical protein